MLSNRRNQVFYGTILQAGSMVLTNLIRPLNCGACTTIYSGHLVACEKGITAIENTELFIKTQNSDTKSRSTALSTGKASDLTGDLYLTTGSSNNTSGTILMYAGADVLPNDTLNISKSSNPGAVNIRGGEGNNIGGSVSMTAGQGDSGGGVAIINGGISNTVNGNGGNVFIKAGFGGNSGGNVIIQGGGATPPNDEGVIKLNGGIKNGVVFPNLTASEISGLSNPLPGTVIYDSTNNKLQVYDGMAFVNLN